MKEKILVKIIYLVSAPMVQIASLASMSINAGIFRITVCSPKYELPKDEEQPGKKPRTPIICHKCGEAGHKAAYCTATTTGWNLPQLIPATPAGISFCLPW